MMSYSVKVDRFWSMLLVVMAFKLLLSLLLLATCSLTALAISDDDFAEFDDEEGEFDFDMPGEHTFIC